MKVTKPLLLSTFFLSLLSLTNCSSKPSVRDYATYAPLAINFNDFYAKSGRYGVYCYGAYCPDCEAIKENIFDYEDLLLNDSPSCGLEKIYLLEFHKKSTSLGAEERGFFKTKDFLIDYNDLPKIMSLAHSTYGANNLSDTYFFFTPSLYIVEDHRLVEFVTDVPSYLSTFDCCN